MEDVGHEDKPTLTWMKMAQPCFWLRRVGRMCRSRVVLGAYPGGLVARIEKDGGC